MRCPFCGSHLENDAKYCNDCGTAVDSECKGKNVNYRSYTVGRPEQTVKNQPPLRNTQFNKPLANNQRPPVNMPPQRPTVNNLPVQQGVPFNPRANTAKKKSGCGIAVLIVVGFFAITSIIGAVLGEQGLDILEDEFDNTGYEQSEEINNNNNNWSEFSDEMRGRFDGRYYLNDWVNFAFRVPDGFSDLSGSVSRDEYFGFFEKDEDRIITGVEYDDNVDDFLERYSSLVSDEIKESDAYDGSEIQISDIKEKTVGDKTFYGFTASCGETDGECRIVDVYATVIDDFVFYVKISASSPETNKQVIESFDNARAE